MSRTIEQCSRHIGPISITPKDTPITVTFEDKNGVGYAMVNEEEAAHFEKLGPDYWLPGRPSLAGQEIPELAEEPREASVLPLDPETYDELDDRDVMKVRLAVTTDRAALMGCIAKEAARRYGRKTWMDALNAHLDSMA